MRDWEAVRVFARLVPLPSPPAPAAIWAIALRGVRRRLWANVCLAIADTRVQRPTLWPAETPGRCFLSICPRGARGARRSVLVCPSRGGVHSCTRGRLAA